MTISQMQPMLAGMRALAAQAGAMPGASAQENTAGSFGSELRASLERIHTLQAEAKDKSQRFQAGAPDVALNDVVLDMQKASIAFQMGMQVRNRLVHAYKEIMAMQV